MTFQEAMTRIRAAGWGGVAVWQAGAKETGNFMGCLIKPNCEPDYDTNLWNYQETAENVLELLVTKAGGQPHAR